MTYEQFTACINACDDCAVACERGLLSNVDDASLAECAEVCRLSSAWMALDSRLAREVAGHCADVCEACCEACERYADVEACQTCAALCLRCAEACRRLAYA